MPSLVSGGFVATPDVTDLVSHDVDGWDIAFAVAAVLVAWIIGRLAQRGVLRLLIRVQGVSEDLRQLMARLAKYLIWVTGAGVALGFLGASVQPILAVTLIVVAVAALTLRGIADNFAAGVVLQTRRPIQIGDEIEVLGYVGVVSEINGRSVVIETYDGVTVHVPNSKVLDNPLVNNSVATHRRSEIEVRASRPGDVAALLSLIGEAVAAVDGVVTEPPSTVTLVATDPVRVTVLVRVWHAPSERARVTSATIAAVALALEQADIPATVVAPPPAAALTPPPAI